MDFNIDGLDYNTSSTSILGYIILILYSFMVIRFFWNYDQPIRTIKTIFTSIAFEIFIYILFIFLYFVIDSNSLDKQKSSNLVQLLFFFESMNSQKMILIIIGILFFLLLINRVKELISFSKDLFFSLTFVYSKCSIDDFKGNF